MLVSGARSCFAALLAALFFAMPGAWAAEPVPVKLAWEGYLGPFYLLAGEAEITLSDTHYRLETRAETRGLARWIFPWQSRAVAAGRRAGDALSPEDFRYEATWNDKTRRVHLSYNGVDPEIEAIDPPPGAVENGPVAAETTRGTIDPFTMTLDLMLSLAAGRPCEWSFKVFDGRRRYDFSVSHGPKATLEESRSSVFNGEAQTCRLFIDRIAGFWEKSRKITDAKTPPVVSMAALFEDFPPFPVRFVAHYKYGSIRIYLTRAERGDTVMALE
jgi:hypothetical protein